MQASTQVTQSKKGGISTGYELNGVHQPFKPTAYIFASDSNMNDVQLGFNDPEVMRKMAQDILDQADQLEKEINA